MNDAPAKRRYDDACGTALALDLVGERWALLVVRELMFGPRRFGQIREQLTGISANVLTQRLEGMIAAGIVERQVLPPPASVGVYALTEWGYESVPIFDAMVRWALRSRRHDPSLPLSPASLMMSMRALIDRQAARDLAIVAGFRFGDDAFVARISGGAMHVERAPVENTEFVLEGSPNALIRVIYGKHPLAPLEAQGAITVSGDREAAERFTALFALPSKVD
ncbi:winged helix-turn-helix transcriptional regulator [Stakelama marina]|uniref:winged helix-turn-helix transcriptional regulator n=1 Tax=Stakelama marina TaxID=2826939 RepID=UPI0024C40F8D|nr:winged helix-turn-helix transcriptional regulator [Stakelama marina]